MLPVLLFILAVLGLLSMPYHAKLRRQKYLRQTTLLHRRADRYLWLPLEDGEAANTTKLQQWLQTLPEGIQHQITTKELWMHLYYCGTQPRLTTEAQEQITSAMQQYEQTIHQTIGTKEGYPHTVLTRSLRFDEIVRTPTFCVALI